VEYDRVRRSTPEYKAIQKASDAKRQNTPKRRKDRRANLLRSKYNLDFAGYQRLLLTQGRTCGICDVQLPTDLIPGRAVNIDHDHQTGKVRGLLCGHCNTMLGQAKDNINTLLNAVTYLEAARL
jgi:hypothetical protein